MAEGGDTMWLDERTLLVGRSYRTNDAGIQALREALPGVEVLAFDLPRLRDPTPASICCRFFRHSRTTWRWRTSH